MKIYKIELNECGYDQYDGFIIKAKDDESAIKLFKDKFASDTHWEKGYKITEISLSGDEEVLLASFNAG